MSKKTYSLELTAEELSWWSGTIKGTDGTAKSRGTIARRIDALAATARADVEAEALRLPWKAERYKDSIPGWALRTGPPGFPCALYTTERAAKLLSAAPELLAAVKAAHEYARGAGSWANVQLLIDRAFRKVDSGVPE